MEKFEKIAMLMAIEASKATVAEGIGEPTSPEEIFKLFEKQANAYSEKELLNEWEFNNGLFEEAK